MEIPFLKKKRAKKRKEREGNKLHLSFCALVIGIVQLTALETPRVHSKCKRQ